MRTHCRFPQSAGRNAGNAFTLTELLIVIALIVLVITLAVPAFRAMSGGRSIDAAQNQLSAVLGAARSEAIGLQKVRGVFFYLDPATERVNAALVQEVGGPEEPPKNRPLPDLYLDLVPDRDPIALPVGVGLQGVDNADVEPTGNPPKRKDDGYIGYNLIEEVEAGPLPGAPLRYGGVILFDGYGRVINKYYGFLLGRKALKGSNKKMVPTRIAELFGYAPDGEAPPCFIPKQNIPGNLSMNAQPSQSLFGFILYDAEPFRSLGHADIDPQFSRSDTYDTKETAEETWLDQNAAPILINRYNGTLVRGE